MDQHEPPEALHGLGDGTRVLVEPDDGVLPLLELIGGARRSVYIKQFTFTQSAIFPGTVREVTVFIPAQYDGSKPACVSVICAVR